MAIINDQKKALEFYGNSEIFANKRRADSRDDFGEPEDAGWQLRRKGKSMADYDMATDFGMFLGQHQEGWIVGIKSPDASTLTGYESFPSLGQLKLEWELD